MKREFRVYYNTLNTCTLTTPKKKRDAHEMLRQKWSKSMFVALGNVATAFLAIATTYFVHHCENNNNDNNQRSSVNFCPSFITSKSISDNFYCGENGKFCRRSRRNEFDDDAEEEDADAPNLFNACVHARAKVESQIFGQTESTDILLDAICDKFREIERYESEEEDLGERREEGVEEERQTPLVMSIHGSPGVGKSHFHRALARAVYGANRRRRRKNGGGAKAYGEMLASVARNVVTGGVRGSYYASERKKKTCPGELCPAYKILFGAEYVEKDRERQKRMIVSNLRAHLRRYPESVVVIEEYDKLPCEVRSVLRQLFDSGRVMQSTPSSSSSFSSSKTRRRKKRGGAFSRWWRRGSEEEEDSARSNGGDEDDEDEDGNDTFEDYDVYGEKREVLGNKAIFILEANAGFVHIHGAAEADRKRRLSKVGDVDKNKNKNYLKSERERHHVELSRALKNAMFTKWEKEHCEDFHDTVKVLSSIEYFVPFQPLDEDALKQIANAHLEYRSNYLIENEFISSMLTTLSSSSSSRESPTSSVASLPQMDAIKRRVNVTLSWDDRLLSFLARESEFEGEFAIEGGKEVKSTLSRTVTRAIRRALLPPSTTTNEEKNGGGKTIIHSSFARYEKIRDFILEDSKKKFASGDKAGSKTKDEEGKEAEDALLQINVRLAVVDDDDEDAMQKNPETKDSNSQRRRSVVASIFLIDN